MRGISLATLICIKCKKEFTSRKGISLKNGLIFCIDHQPAKVKNEPKRNNSTVH